MGGLRPSRLAPRPLPLRGSGRSIASTKTSASSTARVAQAVDLYDTDFFEWTQRTAHRLRARRFAEVDVEHVAEEVEDMGNRATG
jgi:hypothetical protein